MGTTLSLDKFSHEAKMIITNAQEVADKLSHKYVEAIHLLEQALYLPSVIATLEENKVNVEQVRELISHIFEHQEKTYSSAAHLSKSMLTLLKKMAEGSSNISVNNLIRALFENEKVSALCAEVNINQEMFESTLTAPEHIINLSKKAINNELMPIVGREKETQRLLQVIGKKEKRHLLIVGNRGVGKKALIEALAYKSTDKNADAALANLLVLRCDAFRFIDGAKTRSDVAKRVNELLSSIKEYRNDCRIALHLNHAERLFSSNGNALVNVAVDLLQLLSDQVHLFICTTDDNYKKFFEREGLFARDFSLLNIDPVSEAQAMEILRGVSSKYEKHHNIQIGNKEIETIVKLAKRYIQDRNLPESAIDLLDEALAYQKIEIDGIPAQIGMSIARLSSIKAQMRCLSLDVNGKQLKKKLVEEGIALEKEVSQYFDNHDSEQESEPDRTLSESSIAAVIGAWTGISVSKALEGESAKLTRMEEQLRSRVVGQDESLKALAKAVRRNSAGLRETGKPIGSFLFLGPSGTGKTESCKALAEFLFDDEKAMVRIDMSEFMEKHMAQRLIGAPPGYAGFDDGGFLTEAIKRKPYSVILFDEVEKGHPDVFNLLLQLLDDGRLTDGKGRTTDFSNTVVVMTSNIGSKHILDADPTELDTEEGREKMKEIMLGELKNHLRPEFINRIDNVTVFNQLREEVLLGILDIQVKRIEKMMEARNIKLSISDEAKVRLVAVDYNPGFGARPLKRALTKYVQDPLSEMLIENKIENKTVSVSYSGSEFRLEVISNG